MSPSPAIRSDRRLLANFGVSRVRLAGPARRSAAEVERDHTVAAAETIALVLDDNSPLPETPKDVEDLAARLRGHVNQLGAVLPAGESALTRAQQLSPTALPDGYMTSRVHLVLLAEATHDLVEAARRLGCAEPNAAGPAREEATEKAQPRHGARGGVRRHADHPGRRLLTPAYVMAERRRISASRGTEPQE
jgi:hypothetical protein